MKITSTNIVDGIIDDKHGKRGTQFSVNQIPNCSLPFTIHDAPANTKSFAIVLEDKDAIPVSGGFAWIHWTAANITSTDIKENASINADFIQGLNSWTSIQGGEQQKDLCACFGGFCPPDAPHTYELHVYALDTILDLENGYYMNEMFKKMRNHILEESILYGIYNH